MNFTPTPHPVLKLPDKEQSLAMGAEKLKEFFLKREELIRLEKADPFRYGYELESWRLAEKQWSLVKELLFLGGNRAGKSDYAAKRVVKKLVEKENAKVWCFQTSAPNSVEMQQPLVWKYLPAEWKNLKKGRIANISFAQKTGFAENTFVCPNGSQCWFRNYMQSIDTIEGGEVDFIWADELVPEDWLKTMRYRLVTRGGELLVTFTPIEGYSPTVKKYLSGAKTLDEVDAPLLPKEDGNFEKVPRLQETANKQSRIVYFHTQDNPYGGYENIVKALKGAGKSEILCRAYGVPTKAIANRFPKFSDRVHIIPADRVPEKGTRYLIVDPCGGRNWFMTWILIDVRGRAFVYREWPCQKIYVEGVGYPGPWAESDGKKADGQRGSAQQPFGFGLKRYIEEIAKLEGKEQVFERLMDSRYGNAQTVAKEHATTLIDECDELGMSFRPTPGDNIDEGIDLINTWLDYDLDKPIDSFNEPKLYISEACENTIYALREWTGQDGKHGACKDPIDNLRYALLAGLDDVSDDLLMCRRGSSY